MILLHVTGSFFTGKFKFATGLPKPGLLNFVLIQGGAKSSLDDHSFGYATAVAWQLTNQLHGGSLTPPVPQKEFGMVPRRQYHTGTQPSS